MRLVEKRQEESLLALDVCAQQCLEPEQVTSDRRCIAAAMSELMQMHVVLGKAGRHRPDLLMLELEEPRCPWRPGALVQLGIQPVLLPCRVWSEHTVHPCQDLTELLD